MYGFAGWSHALLSIVLAFPLISCADNDDCSLSLVPLKNGRMVQVPNSDRVILYYCNSGFTLEGPRKQACVNGSWTPPTQPFCTLDDSSHLSQFCPIETRILNSRAKFGKDVSFNVPKGAMASVDCSPGFSTDTTFELSFVIVCGPNGRWTMPDGSINLARCTKKRCPNPPQIPRALYRFNSDNNHMGDGMQVEYYCSRDSVLLEETSALLTCRNGQWEGPIPTCVQRATCDTPAYIPNGRWVLRTQEKKELSDLKNADGYTKFKVGEEVKYSCSPDYKLVGPVILQCIAAQIWSTAPPICLPSNGHIWYCPIIDQIKNGYCKCMGQETADLQLCMPFKPGTRIECTCLNGYSLDGSAILSCTHTSSLNIGVWDRKLPICYEDDNIDMIPDGQIRTNGDKGYNSGDISDDKNKVSSLVIVITTGCSVLGVLGLIMVIVIFRKKKPRAHIFQQSAAAPPYARVHNSLMDEHDRLALMAYAEASRVHLPSYEEAMRPSHIASSAPGAGGNRSISPTTLEYQRLPNVHIRGAIHSPYGGDGNNNINNNNNNNNRHSTVTTSTMNRDGVSEIFGSMDTVNVSMSDASTSVTVETFDSGTSNRSMASQRAYAGSLNSSEDHLETDDAPLLETSSQRDADVVSVSSTNPSHTSKDD